MWFDQSDSGRYTYPSETLVLLVNKIADRFELEQNQDTTLQLYGFAMIFSEAYQYTTQRRVQCKERLTHPTAPFPLHASLVCCAGRGA